MQTISHTQVVAFSARSEGERGENADKSVHNEEKNPSLGRVVHNTRLSMFR